MTTDTHKVFVYGTLRKHAGTQEVTHRLMDYAMYDYGRFPYIVPMTGAFVLGTVLDVDDEDLEELDRYEGVARGLYTREKVKVTNIGTGRPIVAFVYVATNQIHPRRIEGGDWYCRDESPASL